MPVQYAIILFFKTIKHCIMSLTSDPRVCAVMLRFFATMHFYVRRAYICALQFFSACMSPTLTQRCARKSPQQLCTNVHLKSYIYLNLVHAREQAGDKPAEREWQMAGGSGHGQRGPRHMVPHNLPRQRAREQHEGVSVSGTICKKEKRPRMTA
jgi:hypothetical protein